MAGEMFQLQATLIGDSIMRDDINQLKSNLAAGENPFFADRKGNTYLHLCAAQGSVDCIHVLVSTGINLNSQNRHGNTALHVSALYNECANVMNLMSSGVNPLIRNRDGKLPEEVRGVNAAWLALYRFYWPGLFRAVEQGDVIKTKFLLQNWCRVDVKRDGLSPQQVAAFGRHYELISVIEHFKTSLDMVYGILEDDERRVASALRKGACNTNLVRCTHLRHHPLQLAMKKGYLKYAKWLCEPLDPEIEPANVNTRVHIQGYFEGPLYFEVLTMHHRLSEETRSQFLDLLLQPGRADLHERDSLGRSLLHFAFLHLPSQEQLLRLLRKVQPLRSFLASRDFNGLTLRHLAEFLEYNEVVKLIDFELVCSFRAGEVEILRDLARHGYTDLLKFNLHGVPADVYAMAAVTQHPGLEEFLNWFQQLMDLMPTVHRNILNSDTSFDSPKQLIDWSPASPLQEHLTLEDVVLYKDPFGRNVAHLAIVRGNVALLEHILEGLLSQTPQLRDRVFTTEEDNLRRTPLDYLAVIRHAEANHTEAEAMEAVLRPYYPQHTIFSSRFMRQEIPHSRDSPLLNLSFMWDSLVELEMLRNFQRLRHIITTKGNFTKVERLEEASKALRKLSYPLKELIHKMQHLTTPLKSTFPHLGVECVRHKRWSILKLMIQYGLDLEEPMYSTQMPLVREETLGINYVQEERTTKLTYREPQLLKLRDWCQTKGYPQLVHFIDDNLVAREAK